MGPEQPAFAVMELLPMILISMPFAIGMYYVAGRLDRNALA
jgi:hypothetical protein